MKHCRRYHLVVSRIAVFVLVPTIPQVVAEQVVQAVGQVAVLLVFHTGLRVGHFLLGLGAVLIFLLVYQILCQLAASQVDAQLPAVVTVK